jgi:glycosyltransferase involved in cell wall biosynthesis
MKPKMVHLVSSPATSGVTATIKLVAMGLRDAWEPILVHYGRHEGIAPEFLNEGMSVRQIKAPPLFFRQIRTLWTIISLRKTLRDIGPCLVNAHSFDADLMAARALPTNAAPIVVTSQSFSYVQWVKNHLKDYERLGKRFSVLIPVCASLGTEILKIPAMSNMKMRVVFNVPDKRFFEPIEISERERHRNRLGIDSSDVVVACVANFYAVKGQDILADAFKMLTHKYSNLKLIIAGSAGSDSVRRSFQASVKTILKDELSQGKAIIIDPCHDARLILSTADIYVQPSRTEALSVSIGEAMASGLPIIATAVGGNPEIVIDGKTGILAPPNSSDVMAVKLESLIGDPALRQEIGKGAKMFALEHLTSSALLAEYRHIYESALHT